MIRSNYYNKLKIKNKFFRCANFLQSVNNNYDINQVKSLISTFKRKLKAYFLAIAVNN